MDIYYDLRDGRLNVYKLEDSIFKYIGGCGFNRESYFIKELKEKIFEVFSEKNKDIKLEDLEFMNLRFLYIEEAFQKMKFQYPEKSLCNTHRRKIF